MDNWRDLESLSVMWWKVGNDQDTLQSWLYVSALFRGAAAFCRNTDTEISCYFLAELAHTKAGL